MLLGGTLRGVGRSITNPIRSGGQTSSDSMGGRSSTVENRTKELGKQNLSADEQCIEKYCGQAAMPMYTLPSIIFTG